jgi:hypothetical protein
MITAEYKWSKISVDCTILFFRTDTCTVGHALTAPQLLLYIYFYETKMHDSCAIEMSDRKGGAEPPFPLKKLIF